MSLNWNAKDVKNWKEISTGKKDMMIYGLMLIGMQKVIEENLAEVQARVHLHQKLFGEWLSKREEGADHCMPQMFTGEDCKEFIGLTTNVSTESRAAFNKRMLARFYKEAHTDEAYLAGEEKA